MEHLFNEPRFKKLVQSVLIIISLAFVSIAQAGEYSRIISDWSPPAIGPYPYASANASSTFIESDHPGATRTSRIHICFYTSDVLDKNNTTLSLSINSNTPIDMHSKYLNNDSAVNTCYDVPAEQISVNNTYKLLVNTCYYDAQGCTSHTNLLPWTISFSTDEPQPAACGSSSYDGIIYTSAPTTNLCVPPSTASRMGTLPNGNSKSWAWYCTGEDNKRILCTAKYPKVDGVCGPSNGGIFSSEPTTGLCDLVNAGQVVGSATTSWSWICYGYNGGYTLCGAQVPPQNGSCGSSSGQTFNSKPTTNLCSVGEPLSGVTGTSSTSWLWTCKGIGSGSNQNCEAYTPKQLIVKKAGNGVGTIETISAPLPPATCGTTCSYTYNHGAGIYLKATPAVGSIFAGWSGACTGKGECIISITSNQEATATFQPNIIPILKSLLDE